MTPSQKIKVELIDDDPDMHRLIKRLLEENGYDYCGSTNSKEGCQILQNEHPDLLLLDVMMPVTNGFDLCRQIREQGRQIPIVFLTAKGDIVDKSTGFNAGADDYVVKPFSSEELLLRIQAHVRRQRGNLATAKPTERAGSKSFGDLEIVFNQYEVRVAGEKVDLTAKEFEILALLAANPEQVFTRKQIADHIWGEGSEVDNNSITVFVRKIREKIETNPSEPRYLVTVWRVGYKFEP